MNGGHLLISPLKRPSRFKIVPASYCCFITRFMYPSGVFSKISNEHSRHYSTILTGNQTVLKNLTFPYTKLRQISVMHISPQVRELDKFSWLLKSGILGLIGIHNSQLKEFGIQLTIGIQYLESKLHV